jgi:ribonuclease BN (tRNA processing enzyme)
MFLDDELTEKKGWGHSSIEQGIAFANKIQVKNFLISHHSPSRKDNEIDELQNKFSLSNIKFASENEVIDF